MYWRTQFLTIIIFSKIIFRRFIKIPTFRSQNYISYMWIYCYFCYLHSITKLFPTAVTPFFIFVKSKINIADPKFTSTSYFRIYVSVVEIAPRSPYITESTCLDLYIPTFTIICKFGNGEKYFSDLVAFFDTLPHTITL